MTKSFVATLGGCLLLASTAWAAEATFTWEPVTHDQLAGYKIYYGNDVGPPFNGDFIAEGASPITILLSSLEDPQHPKITIRGIPSCIHAFFVCTAFTTDGLESDFSNMVEATLVDRPKNVTVGQGPVKGSINITWDALRPDDRGSLARFRIHYDSVPYAGTSDGGVLPVDGGLTDATPGDDGSLQNPPATEHRAAETYLGTEALEGPSPLLTDAKATAFSLTGLTPGATYYVAVEAVCPDNEMNISEEVSGQAATADGQGQNLFRDPPSQGCCSVSAADPVSAGTSLLGALLLLTLLLHERRCFGRFRCGRHR